MCAPCVAARAGMAASAHINKKAIGHAGVLRLNLDKKQNTCKFDDLRKPMSVVATREPGNHVERENL